MKRSLRSLRSLFFVLAAFLFFSGLGQAEDETISRAPSEMETVVVTASRVTEKKKEVTSNITVISEEDIKNSPAKDLGELLAEKGIGHIQKYPGSLTAIGIRGFRTETHGNDLKGHVLILLNGRRSGTGNVSKIMTKNVERIELIRGPASVQYGSAAMGGIVNVITKRGKGKPTVFVEGKMGSFDYEEVSSGFSGAYKKLDFSVSFTRSSKDDYDTAEGDKYKNTGYDSKENYSVNLGFEFLPKNRIGVIVNSFEADKIGSPNYFSQNDLDDYNNKKNRSIDVIYEGKTSGEKFSWMFRYFNGKDEDKWFDPVASNPTLWNDGVPTKRETDQKGAQGQISAKLGIANITAGFDWINYQIEGSYNPKETEYDNPAGFLLGKVRLLGEKLIFSGGLRYDKYELEVQNPKSDEESDSHLSPRFGVAWLPLDFLKIRVNYGEAFVMPSADELAANYVSGGRLIKGNTELDPEKSTTYEGGFDIFHQSFNASFTYFYTEFKDKIETTNPAPDTQSWDNLGEATISGLEAEFSYDIGEVFDWDFEIKPYLNLTYLTEYKDDETDNDLLYTPETNISYGLKVSDFKGFKARLNFAYTGKKTIQDWESGLWPAPVIEEGGFNVADFTISKKVLGSDKYGWLTLIGDIQNLFNKKYHNVKGYPMDGRSFYLGLRYEY
ncbi:iron complex outermembrane recepter protein [Candidatus Magnetomoraceae bacterium gMMP-13]